MSTLTQFLGNDWRNIMRDSSLRFFLFMPILMFLVAVLGLPGLIRAVPLLEPYKLEFVMFIGVQAGILVGFVFSIILLDEKESQVHLAFKLLPGSNLSFIIARLLPAAVFAWIIGLLTLRFNGVWPMDWWTALKCSPLFFFPGAICTLLVSAFAPNKIYGMAYFKGVDLLLTAPVLYFILEGSWKEIFRALPFWWTFGLINDAVTGADSYIWTLIIGFSYNLLILIILIKLFGKRYWS